MTRLKFPPAAGTYRVLVVPILEPGQTFRDSNLFNLVTALRSGLFNNVTAFFRENSFNQLTVEFQIFGHDIEPRAEPLRLPRAISEYWNPAFERGGFDAVAAGLGASPTIGFDGTESLRLLVRPRQRPQTELDVSFSALSAESSHGAFPVPFAFGSSDELRLRVTDASGMIQDVVVDGLTFTRTVHASTVDADLAAIASHLDARIQAASAGLGLPATAPDLLQPVRLQRLRAGAGQLGTVVLDLSVHPDYGNGMARIEIVSVTGLASLGLAAAAPSSFNLSVADDRNRLQTYLGRRLQLAQERRGFTAGNRPLSDPTVTFSGGMLTLGFRLSEADGGQGSSLEVVSQTGLNKVGFGSRTAVPGAATAGTDRTVRDSKRLLSDVLTLVNDALGAGDQTGWLTAPGRDFRCIYVVFLGNPAAGTWNADPAALAGQRMFKTWTTVTHATRRDVQVLGNWITSVFPATFAIGTACHELSHTLGGVEGPPGLGLVPAGWCMGLPDTYDNDPENQNDLRYLENWDLMANHFFAPHLAGYHKRHLGWIPTDRVHTVPMPNPTGTTAEECWLVPIEHWGPNTEAQVRAVVGGDLPIRQLMEIELPGDGARFLLVEARATGTLFSHSLPFSPALLVTDGIVCSDPQRYVVDFKYRRYAHPLNTGSELRAPGNSFNLATAPELTYEGTVVRVMARQDVGPIPVLHTRVERERADYIDLHFTDANPPWRTPDVWVDWLGNGETTYPEGEPYHQGETVRFPRSGTEPHRLVARVHNLGTVPALDVNVRFYIQEPAGSGDDSSYRFLDDHIIPSVGAGSSELADGQWNVSPTNNRHQCVRAQISDWTIPPVSPSDPVPVFEATTDLWLHNNRAQKNIADFELKSGSDYEPYAMPLVITNDGPEDLFIYLEPFGLGPGFRLTCTPRTLRVPAKGSSQFYISVNADSGVPPRSEFDNTFVLHACRWTRDMESQEAFGGWVLTIRPRQRSTLTISASGQPPNILVTGALPGGTTSDHLWVRLSPALDRPILWKAVPVLASGAFTTTIGPVPTGAVSVQVEAHFDGNDHLASVATGPLTVATAGPGGGPIGPPIGGGGGGGIVVGRSTIGPIGGGGLVPPGEQVDDDQR